MGWKFPEIPRPRPIVHMHYLEHFGASVISEIKCNFTFCLFAFIIVLFQIFIASYDAKFALFLSFLTIYRQRHQLYFLSCLFSIFSSLKFPAMSIAHISRTATSVWRFGHFHLCSSHYSCWGRKICTYFCTTQILRFWATDKK